ncbi:MULTISPECIES: DUF3396 domain-containing protein [Pseudomonas syringae group genomosp. 2]|uniref:DUF3396 domain-containing protein n=1 Tax=Pseudomonas syringae group genomosp. 2 TaxID=251698 RepID=UPI0001CC4332|nr:MULTISPECIES: DUF3396 domain-containing protein [Pseudomonas syringae group genomosp. 2]MCQ3011797.1 DUF3396 domain-containing protein [Pseudomonas savastanoi]
MSDTTTDTVRLLAGVAQQSERVAMDSELGTPVIRLGLITTLYFRNGHTLEMKRRVEACFSRFYDAFKPKLKWQLFKRMRRLSASGFASTRRQVVESLPDEQFIWSIASATQAEVAMYSLFVMNTPQGQADNDRSCLKMVLPWSCLTEPDGLKNYEAWIRYLSSEVQAEHGFGGLACVLPCDGHQYLPWEYRLAQDYIGLMVDPGPHIESLRLLDRIKGVSWYTVLGEGFVRQLGGSDRLRGEMSAHSDIVFHSYRNGLIIRAGAVPELGGRGLPPPQPYVTVNRMIKPVRLQDTGNLHPYLAPGIGFTEETTAQWYARFDEKPLPPVDAGQACPRSGCWFSSAQFGSRRHFDEGELMPAFNHIKSKKTQWFWAGMPS